MNSIMNNVHKGDELMPKTLTNVKEDIMAVTRQMIKESGYSELNIRNIAARCGVAVGTVYNYFSSKDEIITEILLTEWNLMLRRIDQSSRTTAYSPVEMLEVIYNELNSFMINVHGKWFQTIQLENTENVTVSKLTEKKKLLKDQISEKVLAVINSGKDKKLNSQEVKDICDVISRLLISYSNENANFMKLKPSLTALVNSILNT